MIFYYSFQDDTTLGYFNSGDLESINNHPQGTAHSLPKRMKKYIPEIDRFHSILKSFYLALILKEDEGIYGFKSMNRIYDFQPEYADSNFYGYLYPGGAVSLPIPEEEIKIKLS